MREEEITGLLKDLSIEAKILGFSQDVEEGDWALNMVPAPASKIAIGTPYLVEHKSVLTVDVLVLEFSRCLEWLRGRDLDLGSSFHQYHEHLPQLGGGIDDQYFITIKKMKKTNDQGFFKTAKTHHEAIAKCCVKRLEGEDNE